VPIAPLVDLAVALHYVFLVFLVVGGFLALRWCRLIWLHVGAALWGIGILVIGQPCPLTALEDWARGSGSGGGFIDRHVTGVLYPTAWESAAKVVVAVVVLTSWALLVRQRMARSRSDSHDPIELTVARMLPVDR
jgi:Protein of Unknown function (DUF2784)